MTESRWKAVFIPEQDYLSVMKSRVIPALKQTMEDLYLVRRPGKKQHILHFSCERPKAVIIISHGFTESAEKFLEFAWYALHEGLEVYIPDHAGHGKSYRFTGEKSLVAIDSWHSYVDDLLYLAGEIKKRQPGLPLYLYGHSMGGAVAAAAAAIGDGSFSRVILSSPMIAANLGMPALAAKTISGFMSLTRKALSPIPGFHPFDGKETFENSACLSPARFAFYLEQQKADPDLQTCGPSFGWVREALRISSYLLGKAPALISVPVLLLQAGKDTFVSNEAQDQFLAKIKDGRKETFPASKHEIYRSDDETMKAYYSAVFQFIG